MADAKQWNARGTCVYFGDGGIDVRGAPDAENRARLIAAAPELLEALTRLLKHAKWHAAIADEVTPEARADIARADAAITKATGSEVSHG